MSALASLAAKSSWRSSLFTRARSPLWVIVAVSLWTTTACNTALWTTLSRLGVLTTLQGRWFGLALGLMMAAAMTGLLSFLAWRWTLKPALMLMLLAAACGAHFMTGYHVVIDPAMVTNALQTDVHEVRDLLCARLLAVLLILWLLPSVLVWRLTITYGRWTQRLGRNLLQIAICMAALVLLALASFSPLASTMRNHKEVRYLINPLNSAYALAYLAAKPFQRDESTLEPLGRDAQVAAPVATSKPPLLLLVLGETGRSGNFGINGYARDTTPELSGQQVSTFGNAWSCGTSTAASVPCMFSNLGRVGYEARKHNSEGLIDVIQHAGMAVLWLDNQSGCKGVCDRIGSVATANLHHPQLCPDGECFDGIMLEGLDERIAALPPERRARGIVVVMHQLGSHGPSYHLRSPAAYKRFMPECTSNDLQSCDQAGLVNAYDNTIAYTDHVLSSAIDWLKTRQASHDTALVYVADHGESLGENNLFLHGMPYLIAPDVQKHVPWLTWLSEGFARHTRVSTDCLRSEAQRPVSHDHYFHSVLGLLGIRTAAYQQALDAYAPCRDPAAAA